MGSEKVHLDDVQVLVLEDVMGLISEELIEKVTEVNQLLASRTQRSMRYIVLSDFLSSEAKPNLRVLKSSLMNRKNMFNLSAQVKRLNKNMKHYVVEAHPTEWLRVLVQLRKMIFIPRAVIYSDDEDVLNHYCPIFSGQKADVKAEKAGSDHFECGVLHNTKGTERVQVLKDFTQGKSSFLFSKTE